MVVNKAMLQSLNTLESLTRVCLHDSLNDPLQVMILSLAPAASYPKHMHKVRPEFYWVIEGRLRIRIFKEDRSPDCIILDPTGQPGYLMNPGVFHSVENVSHSDQCKFLEVRPGPFDPSDNVIHTE